MRHTTPRNPLSSLLTAANSPTSLVTQPPKDLVDACFQWLYNALEQGKNVSIRPLWYNAQKHPFAQLDSSAAETLPPEILRQLQTRQITPDSILSQFTAEQRQRLQNLRSKRDQIAPIARSFDTGERFSLRNVKALYSFVSFGRTF